MVNFKAVLVLTVALAATVANAADFVPGELIVKYRAGAIRTRTNMNVLYSAAGVKHVRRFGGLMKGYEQLILNDDIKMQDALAALSMSPVVEYVQPNYILTTIPVKQDADAAAGGIPCIPGFDIPGCDPNAKIPCLIPGIPFPPGCEDSPGTPGDPSQPPATRPELQPAPADVVPAVADPDLSKAYGLGKIGATEAWAGHRGNKNIIVAVIDTGVDYNHEDLAFNMWRKADPATGKDIVGFDFVHNDALPFDDQGHGTHTSGTVGAVGGNGIGVSGVSQRVSLMGVKFLSAQGSGTTADAVRGIDFAVENGAKVLSNSWGGPADQENRMLYDAIERAKAKNVLFVAAAGNESSDNDGKSPSYPAAFDNDNLVSVAALDKNDSMPYWSNYGAKTVHVGAPGADVYSTLPGNKYASESGTSMACPHVAGAAALLWSKNPQWTYKKVKEVLMNTADPVAALKGKTITGGRINVLKALRYTD